MRRLHGTKVIETLTWGGLDGKCYKHNPYSDVWLSVQKSAEAIVLERGMTPLIDAGVRTEQEGLNNGSLESERKVRQCKESRKRRNPAALQRIGWNPKVCRERRVL